MSDVSSRPLRRDEMPLGAVAMARFLLGKLLVRELPDGTIVGRIVETEAYLPDDAACHAFRGRTPRNGALFLPPGHAYVYVAYGLSLMMNVSAEAAGVGAGVLIRAVEPLAGIPLMQRHRGTAVLRDLARGPGRLAQALAIDRSLDGIDLCKPGPLWLGTDDTPAAAIGESTRIGLTKDAHRILRFYAPGSDFVSGPKALNR